MSRQLTVRFPRAVAGARVVPGPAQPGPLPGREPPAPDMRPGDEVGQEMRSQVDAERKQLQAARQALLSGVGQLQKLQEDLLRGAEVQLVDLAVGIARKILMQEIRAGRHEIEAIVKEALARVPAHCDVVVHLNPDDWAACRTAREADGAAEPEHVRFVSDPEVGQAECVIETPEGVVESTLERHLSEIAEALKTPE